MAEKKATATAETEQAEVKTQAAKFTLENLAKHCRKLFGVSSCTFAGATDGLSGTYTVEEMKGIIDKWCGKEAR